MSKRMCKKCLLRDMDEDAIYQTVQEHMKSISPERRISEEIYEERLNVCKNCEHLMNGMCRKCGCYVELRALGKGNKCPDVPAKW